MPVTLEQPPSTVVLPKPAPIKAQDFEWVVLTPGNGLPEDSGMVYYALTVEDHAAWESLMVDINRWITQAIWRFDYYAGKDKETQ